MGYADTKISNRKFEILLPLPFQYSISTLSSPGEYLIAFDNKFIITCSIRVRSAITFTGSFFLDDQLMALRILLHLV